MTSLAHLLIGKEYFLKREFILSLRQRFFPEDSNFGVNFQEFVAEQDLLSSFLDFLSTAPFAADHRLAVFWGVDRLSAEEQDRLESCLEKLPSSSVCVLESEQTNAKKNTFLRNLAQKAKLVLCHTPFERDLPVWVESRVKKRGCLMDRNATLFVIACVGADLAQLDAASEQLSLFVHPKKIVALEEVQLLFQKKSHQDVYQLAEFLVDQRPVQALIVLDAVFCHGMRAPEIVAALAGQLERWKKGICQLQAGRAPAEIARDLRVPLFFQDSFFSRVKKLSLQRIQKLTEAILVCDESVKSGQLQERLALEKLIWTT